MILRIWDVTFTVSDLRRAVEFYGSVLQLPKKYEFSDYAGFDCGGIEIGLKTWGQLELPRHGEPQVNLLVDDLDGTVARLKEEGVSFEQEPQEAVWGARFAILRDPEGNRLQLTRIDWPRYFRACAPSS